VPYYPPHPITEEIALTVFPGARPIRLLGPIAGLTAAELVATSKDSYVRPLHPTGTAGDAPAAPGPRLLAAAVQGTWPALVVRHSASSWSAMPASPRMPSSPMRRTAIWRFR